MKVNVDQLLPIGSIVRLKEGEKRLMIFGYDQVNPETEEAFDYSGVFYPEGNIGLESIFMFNHENIEELQFIGYSDIERDAFMANVAEVVAGMNKDTK